MKNPQRNESIHSSALRRQHALVHVSVIMHTLPEYRGTYIYFFFFGGGGGYVLSGHGSQQQISVKTEGYLFSEGYLFAGIDGTLLATKIKTQRKFVKQYLCKLPVIFFLPRHSAQFLLEKEQLQYQCVESFTDILAGFTFEFKRRKFYTTTCHGDGWNPVSWFKKASKKINKGKRKKQV